MNAEQKIAKWANLIEKSSYEEEVNSAVVFYDKARQILNNLQEELNETYGAWDDVDDVEMLDGIVDMKFVLQQLVLAAKEYGLDVDGGLNCVCDNNLLKFTQDIETAKLWLAGLQEKHPTVEMEIREKDVDGEHWYFIVRVKDGKIMKQASHPRVDLTKFVNV